MKRLHAVIGIIIILGLGFFVWWKHGISSANSHDKSQHIFVVSKGKGVREIANDLKTEGLITDPVVFFLLIKRLGLDSKIQAGDFRLSPSMSAYDIAQNLTHGILDIWVTIPEGKRADEIADMLKEKIPSYSEDWRTILNQNEGFLFPDTYLIPKDATIDLVVSLMKNNFETKYATLQISKSDFSKNGIVILASLVEREAKFDSDRPLVASVFVNRINLGMPLQVDATVQYVLGFQKNEHTWWKRNLTRDDLRFPSLYNTYINVGLPPKPIANPGLSALHAAISPSKTDYLYYVSDKSGHNHYAKDLEGHNENIQKYGL